MSKDNWDIIRAKYVAAAVRADQYPQLLLKLLYRPAVMSANRRLSIHSAAATAWHA